jgi:two-component system NarL family response regulator
MGKIRILVIEDNRVLRDGIAMMLNEQADMHVAAMMGSGNDILLKANDAKPHVILLDVGLKNIREASLITSLRRKMPDARVIGMGLVPTQSDIIEFVEAGASGFILKDATVKEFLSTIRSVVKGEKVLPTSMAGSLFTYVVDLAVKKNKGPLTNAVRMSKREREVIAQIAEGLSNKEIAAELNIATHTVKSHVHNIMEKLALHSRLQIAMHANEETAD